MNGAAAKGDFPYPASSELWGVVTAVQANYYWVNFHGITAEALRQPLEALPVSPRARPTLLCTRRARLKKTGQQVMVGDWVRVEEPDWEGHRGAIAEVATRQTVLDRPPIANVNQILLVFALAEPTLDPQQLSRFLVKAESTGLDILLCLNKQDLVNPETCHHWQRRLQQWGYEALVISVQQGTARHTLAPRLQGHVTVVSGPSGVGKSSLINHLIPQASLRTAAVSGKLGRGRHTTRHVELFELPQGGFLADTPGFNQPDLPCSAHQLGHYFPEIRQRLVGQACQFNNCLHRDEPGCGLETDWERYDYYLAMLDEITLESGLTQRREAEDSLKVKVGALGQIHQEPLLAAKKYRRVSRRRQRQGLEHLRYDLPETLEELEDLDDLEGE
ncbi:MAG TPA: small ribosomal subunit biogenesis GTPase RsgA [Leptolyngbyaceae cyanobacterium M65_K2018_010]|nr:small ribosomal subunit biogenesis GTPase RsgA [Leptolyngbyaceae cyanobacterium M65_K2018_010]